MLRILCLARSGGLPLGQIRRYDLRLPSASRSAEEGARHLDRERWQGALTFDISNVSLQPAAAEAEEASVGGGDAQGEPAVEGFERAGDGCP